MADEDGIAIIPAHKLAEVYQAGKARTEAAAAMNLTQWQAQHQKKINSKLQELGYGTQ